MEELEPAGEPFIELASAVGAVVVGGGFLADTISLAEHYGLGVEAPAIVASGLFTVLATGAAVRSWRAYQRLNAD